MAHDRAFDWITFDCYGTLVDWEGGIFNAFAAAAADGVALDREAVLAAYAEVEPAMESGSFRDYRDVLAATARGLRSNFPLQTSEVIYTDRAGMGGAKATFPLSGLS